MNLTLDLSWMAWTWPTATFFIVIALMLVGMTLWEWAVPGGSPRYGILGIETTRGDRFFVSLLGSAFITLAWLGLSGQDLWWALVVCAVWALGVFRWV